MNTIPTHDLVVKMRALAEQAHSSSEISSSSTKPFQDVLKQALDQVSFEDVKANQLAEDFASGRKDVSLVDTMVAVQKSNISFQALTEVRNKVVHAYQEIMNMSI